jgi:hypothetical protein
LCFFLLAKSISRPPLFEERLGKVIMVEGTGRNMIWRGEEMRT